MEPKITQNPNYDWLLGIGLDPSRLHSVAEWERVLNSLPPFDSIKLRYNYASVCGCPILTLETVELLASALRGRRVLEVGCGNGFLAHQLQQRGVSVSPIDDAKSEYIIDFCGGRHCEVLQVDVKDLDISEYEVVLMSWPDDDRDTASHVARKMRKGQYLIYQGESKGGCTADTAFFSLLDQLFKEYNVAYNKLNSTHVVFPHIHDRWQVFKKTKEL